VLGSTLQSGEQLQVDARGQWLYALLLEEDDSGEVGRMIAQIHDPPAGKGSPLPKLGTASPQGDGPNAELNAPGQEPTRVSDQQQEPARSTGSRNRGSDPG
jgi:hypothetical protein